jgi:heat shock protein HslJ
MIARSTARLGLLLCVAAVAVPEPVEARNSSPRRPTILDDTQWHVVAIDGVAPLGYPPLISFHNNGVVNVTTSCNIASGNFHVYVLGWISTSFFQATTRVCPDPAGREEAAVHAVLTSLRSFRISNEKGLVLKARDGRTVEARR